MLWQRSRLSIKWASDYGLGNTGRWQSAVSIKDLASNYQRKPKRLESSLTNYWSNMALLANWMTHRQLHHFYCSVCLRLFNAKAQLRAVRPRQETLGPGCLRTASSTPVRLRLSDLGKRLTGCASNAPHRWSAVCDSKGRTDRRSGTRFAAKRALPEPCAGNTTPPSTLVLTERLDRTVHADLPINRKRPRIGDEETGHQA